MQQADPKTVFDFWNVVQTRASVIHDQREIIAHFNGDIRHVYHVTLITIQIKGHE